MGQTSKYGLRYPEITDFVRNTATYIQNLAEDVEDTLEEMPTGDIEVIQENGTATTENVYSASAVDNKLAQIIESGSNTKGSYIKYSDGTMICYASIRIGKIFPDDYYDFCKFTGFSTVTFPMEFDEVPNVTVTNRGYEFFSSSIDSITVNNFECGSFMPPSATSVPWSFQYVAIGKWK